MYSAIDWLMVAWLIITVLAIIKIWRARRYFGAQTPVDPAEISREAIRNGINLLMQRNSQPSSFNSPVARKRGLIANITIWTGIWIWIAGLILLVIAPLLTPFTLFTAEAAGFLVGSLLTFVSWSLFWKRGGYRSGFKDTARTTAVTLVSLMAIAGGAYTLQGDWLTKRRHVEGHVDAVIDNYFDHDRWGSSGKTVVVDGRPYLALRRPASDLRRGDNVNIEIGEATKIVFDIRHLSR